MPYIHEQPAWPDLTWDVSVLAARLAAVRHRQGRLLGRMESLGFDLRTQAGLSTLTADVVKSSAIEGEQLDTNQVRSSIASRLGLQAAGLPTPARHVEGVVEMMLDAVRCAEDPLSHERLCAWQSALFPSGLSHLRRITVGAYRPATAGPMRVVSGPIGRERVHFEAPHADRLGTEMDAFLAWFNAPPAIDPVLKAGLAHFWFITIHPFEDGNGRIARAIADMALTRADATDQRYYSMSSQIETERREYYLQLERAQRGTTDITPWMSWFLACLGRAVDRADEAQSGVLHKAEIWKRLADRPVNPRQRTVLNRMTDAFEGHLNTSKYAKLAKCSTDTALRDIRELLAWGVLAQNPAGGRSTSYRLATPGDLTTAEYSASP
jgi:Fic family protein